MDKNNLFRIRLNILAACLLEEAMFVADEGGNNPKESVLSVARRPDRTENIQDRYNVNP